MKVSVVSSVVDSFCWNNASDIFYSNCAGVRSVTVMLVDLSVAIMQVVVSAALMQVTMSTANIWVKIFYSYYAGGVYVAIIQVVYSAVHYEHD